MATTESKHPGEPHYVGDSASMSGALSDTGSLDDKPSAKNGKGDSDEEGEASDDGEVSVNGKNADKEEGELEDGEVDEEEEGEEKKEVCKYFFRGQCTWGSNCKYTHASGADKGNYNMFEESKRNKEDSKNAAKNPRPRSPLVGLQAPLPGVKMRLPMIPPEFFPPIPEPPRRESAWERSTRQAKHLAQSAAKKRETMEDNLHGFVDAEMENEYGGEEKQMNRRPSPRAFPPLNRQDFEAMMRRSQNQSNFFPRQFDRRRDSPPPMDNRRHNNNNMQNNNNNNNNRPQMNRQRNADEWQDPWMRSRSPPRKRDNWPRRASPSPVSRSRSRTPKSGSDHISRNSRTSAGSRSRDIRPKRSVSPKRRPARSPSGSPISSKSAHSPSGSPPPVENRRNVGNNRETNGKRKRSPGQRSGASDLQRNDSTLSPSLSNVSDSEDGPRTPPPEDTDEDVPHQRNQRPTRTRNRSASPVSVENDEDSRLSTTHPVDSLPDEPFNKKQKKTHKPVKLTLQNNKNRTAASSAFRGYDDEEEDDPESPANPEKARKSPSVDKDRTSPLSEEEQTQKPKTPLAPEDKAEKQKKREDLLLQLRAVELAIARKKANKPE